MARTKWETIGQVQDVTAGQKRDAVKFGKGEMASTIKFDAGELADLNVADKIRVTIEVDPTLPFDED